MWRTLDGLQGDLKSQRRAGVLSGLLCCLRQRRIDSEVLKEIVERNVYVVNAVVLSSIVDQSSLDQDGTTTVPCCSGCARRFFRVPFRWCFTNVAMKQKAGFVAASAQGTRSGV